MLAGVETLANGSAESRVEEGFCVVEGAVSFRCAECNGAFQKPLLATLMSGKGAEKYYACPRCLSKVDYVEHGRRERSVEVSASRTSVEPTAEKQSDKGDCKHFLGYLKKRPKDAPIPDECLTCDRMIECMIR